MTIPSRHGPSDPGGEPPKRGISSGVGRAAVSARSRAMRIALAHDLIRAGRVLERRGMIAAAQGNLSARVSPERMLITRAGRRKGELTTRDFVEIVLASGDDTPDSREVSKEHRVHRAGYAARGEAESILHAHPVALTAFAIRGRAPDFSRFDEGRIVVGAAALVPYHVSGTQALADAVRRALETAERPQLLLLENHGAVSLGRTVDEALSRLETAEHLAAILLAAERG